MERAQSQSSAPIRWATCTEKPVDAAAQSPQKSHVVVDTNPIEAEAFAPRRKAELFAGCHRSAFAD